MLLLVRQDLAAAFDAGLVDELLGAYAEAKRHYALGGDRLSAVEGGRFCEAAFRVLEQAHTGAFTALGRPLADTEKLIRQVESNTALPDGIRIHIPRTLRVVYDIRNKRDNAHLADDIDPNVQDSTIVVSALDWVMAEFVRIYHSVPAEEAQRIVNQLVERQIPVVQDFDGFLKVLRPDLAAGDHCLVLLYQRGDNGASFEDMERWAQPAMRANLRRTLDRLVDSMRFVHFDGTTYRITHAGSKSVEDRQLLDW